MKHIIYFPASYATLLYSSICAMTLLMCLFVGVIKHPKELLTTHCKNYEFWPSISTTIGDMMPERQMWRMAMASTLLFLIGSTISLFNFLWQKCSNGMVDIDRSNIGWKNMLLSSSFLSILALIFDVIRIMCALVWTMVASMESLLYHNMGFGFYLFSSFMMQLSVYFIIRRNRYNLSAFPSQKEGKLSCQLKLIGLVGQTICGFSVVGLYIRHNITCAPGSFSVCNIFEWGFATFNLFFDATLWFELKSEGWWISGSPAFYKMVIENKGFAAILSKKVEETKDATPVIIEENQNGVSSSESFVVHKFTFACPPASLTMWICDVYWSYLSFSMMIHFFQHIYFMPLVAMSLSWELGLAVAAGSPMLLAFTPFRRWALGPTFFSKSFTFVAYKGGNPQRRVVPMYIFFYFAASLSHLQMLVTHDDRGKIMANSFGPFFLNLAIFSRFLYPSTASSREANCEDGTRIMYAFPLGFALSMLLRVLWISQDPLFVEPFYAAIFGIFFGLVMTLNILRHTLFRDIDSAQDLVKEDVVPLSPKFADQANEKRLSGPSENSKHSFYDEGDAQKTSPNTLSLIAVSHRAPSPFLLGLMWGLTTSFCMTFFICANYIPRSLAIEPYPASLFVIFAFAFGLIYSPDVIPIHSHVWSLKQRNGIISSCIQASLRGSWSRFGIVLLSSCLTMVYATRQTNRTFEKSHPFYPVGYDTPRDKVLISDWYIEEDFFGSKYLSFFAALIMTFCIAALIPIITEIVFVHQLARRHVEHSNLLKEISSSSRSVSSFALNLIPFEVSWFFSMTIIIISYSLCTSYPFVPFAEILREQTAHLIILHVCSLFLLAFFLKRKIIYPGFPTSVDFQSPRKQRTIPNLVLVSLFTFLFFVVVGRSAFAPDNHGYPEGKKTAIQFPSEVLYVHEKMKDLFIQRNNETDPSAFDYEKRFYHDRYDAMMDQLELQIKGTDDIIPKADNSKLTPQVREDIWEAAKGMTFFSGLIWTLHFAMDNHNLDSLSRLLEKIKSTNAGVVGLLESDAMHIPNGNRDIVEYVSYYLGYPYSDYGPTAMDNNYGCGLVSKYPIVRVRRYQLPSPLGELSCLIHAQLDVFGIIVQVYVAHFGNTQHWADGLLQSQFLRNLVLQNPGPSLFLGYLVTFPGALDRYFEYSHPSNPGLLRDTALELYKNHTWLRLKSRGGYDEKPPVTVTKSPGESVDFNVEYKLAFVKALEGDMKVDESFRRTPPGLDPRTFYFNQTNRYTINHPRFEFIDRYCQYNFYKTGKPEDELPQYRNKLQPMTAYLYDWIRIVDGGVEELSDTEIQITYLGFKSAKEDK